jgi:hypothetical protein
MYQEFIKNIIANKKPHHHKNIPTIIQFFHANYFHLNLSKFSTASQEIKEQTQQLAMRNV